MMRRRLIRSTTLIGCAALLAACGGGGGEVAIEAPTPSGTGTSATASNPATSTGGPAAGGTPVDAALGDMGVATSTGGGALPESSGEDVEVLGSLNGNGLFKPQASFEEDMGDDSGGDMGGDTGMAPSAPGGVSSGGGGTGTAAPSPTPPSPASPTASYTQAKVSLNGQVHVVQRGTVFPKAEQLFKVTSITADSVVVELVAGEFKNGSQGITLDRGKKVELVNQDEGGTYTLKLISTSTGTSTPISSGGSGGSTTAPTGSTTPPPGSTDIGAIGW